MGKNLNDIIFDYKLLLSSDNSSDEIESAVNSQTIDVMLAEAEAGFLTEEFNMQEVGQSGVGTQSSASSDQDELFSNKAQDVYAAPFSPANNVGEQVGLGSGSLNYTVTDAVLPGAGGLNLAIERIYDSNRAAYYQENARFTNATLNIYEYYYEFAKNPDGTMGARTGENLTGSLQTNAVANSALFYEIDNYKRIVDLGDCFRVYFLRFANGSGNPSASNVSQESYPITPDDELWELGTGWRFNFSHFIDGQGFSENKELFLSDGRAFTIYENYINNLGYYTYEDLHVDLNPSGSVLGQPISLEVLYADGKVESFHSSGR
jgi:hypothetical protein